MKPVIWLLGLSGSGKSTLGSLLRLYLESQGEDVALIDENSFRAQLEGQDADMDAALRGHVLECQAQGQICIVCSVTAEESQRQKNREELPFYHEIWVRCSLTTLVERDPKGIYARAAAGEDLPICGLNQCFDEPHKAHCVVNTDLDLADSYMELRQAVLEIMEKCAEWQELRSEIGLPRSQGAKRAGQKSLCGF